MIEVESARLDQTLRAPWGCVNGCSGARATPVRVSERGPPPANAWAGPEYLAESKQTAHGHAPGEAGLGGGALLQMDGRDPFGPAPILRAPWGDVAEFPAEAEAWQSNAHQVNHLLDRGLRAVAAARAELRAAYGEYYNRVASVASACTYGAPSFMPEASREGTIRRLLHAIITSAPYTIVLAGHSAAQAAGNHFNQSYTHWLHSLLAPPLAAVGVQLVTRNHAMGGLSSVHRASCFACAYGADVDAVMWDYAMTAGSAAEMDYFFKQAMMQPRRPLLIGFQTISAAHGKNSCPRRNVSSYSGQHLGLWELLMFYEHHGYHIAGVPGSVESWTAGEASGTPSYATRSAEQALSLPPNLRYLHCRANNGQLLSEACREQAYDCHCFDDYASSGASKQHAIKCSGQASWHPGWRAHRIRGHMAAAMFLDAFETALTRFQQEASVGTLPLEPEFWHASPLIDDQARAASAILAVPSSPCEASSGHSALGCNVTYHCATEFEPRVGASISDFVVNRSGVSSKRLRGSWRLNRDWWQRQDECPASGQRNARDFYEGDNTTGWLLLRLPEVRDGVFSLNNWGVSALRINWGSDDWGNYSARGITYRGLPNAELWLNGRRITSCEPLGSLYGGSVARVPDLAGAGVVELALRVKQHPDAELQPRLEFMLSHVMWR